MPTDHDLRNLRKLLSDFLAVTGFTVPELCSYLGISKRTYKRWTKGTVEPKPASYRKVTLRINEWYANYKPIHIGLTLHTLSQIFRKPSSLPVVEQYALLAAAAGLVTGYLVQALGDKITTPVITGLYLRRPELKIEMKGLDVSSSISITLTVESNIIRCECRSVTGGRHKVTLGVLSDDMIAELIKWLETNIGIASKSFNHLVKE